jgi:hypothetical protein
MLRQMNERIQQLAEQAGCKVMDDGEWYIPSATGLDKIVYTKGIGLEKFAELIVGECVGIADEYDGVGSTIVSRIKKHFGVEE